MTNEELLKLAYTRELTDERVIVAAAYWLDASPHEQIKADGVILARYARQAMETIYKQQQEIERLRAALASLPDQAMQVDSFADGGDVPAFPLESPTVEDQEEWFDSYCKAQRELIEGLVEDALSHQTEQPASSLQADYDALQQKHKVVVKLLHEVSNVLIDGNARKAWLMIMDWVRDNAPGQAEPPDQRIELRPALLWFAQQMELALRKNDYKGGWEGESATYLDRRMLRAIHDYSVEREPRHLVNAANYSMMLADNARRQPAPKGEDSNA